MQGHGGSEVGMIKVDWRERVHAAWYAVIYRPTACLRAVARNVRMILQVVSNPDHVRNWNAVTST